MIGLDLTIAPSHEFEPLAVSENDIEEEVTANADKHLQKSERRKLMPEGLRDATTGELLIHGDTYIGDLNRQNYLLFPIAIDRDGGLGPLTRALLFGETPREHQKPFRTDRPNATLMYHRITNPPAPLGIVNTAAANWSRTRERAFFGHSYTAPTPREYLMQKLGLSIVKALAVHLRNSFRKLGTHPNPNFVRTPPGFNPEIDPRENTVDTRS